jgi:hypothetical protein
VTELLARVGGSSVTANCPRADQGGRHVDMVVGADHRGRAGVGVWRDAATGPLTALRQRPDHAGAAAGSGRRLGGVAGGVQAQRAPPTTQRCPAQRVRVRRRGWGQWVSATPSSPLLEGRAVRPRGAMSGAWLGWTPLSHLGQVRCCRGGGWLPWQVVVSAAGMWVDIWTIAARDGGARDPGHRCHRHHRGGAGAAARRGGRAGPGPWFARPRRQPRSSGWVWRPPWALLHLAITQTGVLHQSP